MLFIFGLECSHLIWAPTFVPLNKIPTQTQVCEVHLWVYFVMWFTSILRFYQGTAIRDRIQEQLMAKANMKGLAYDDNGEEDDDDEYYYYEDSTEEEYSEDDEEWASWSIFIVTCIEK